MWSLPPELISARRGATGTAFGVLLAHDGKIDEKLQAGIQVALLYTTMGGMRRIRVHNIVVPVTPLIASVFRMVELDTVTNLLAKQGAPCTYPFSHRGNCPRVDL